MHKLNPFFVNYYFCPITLIILNTLLFDQHHAHSLNREFDFIGEDSRPNKLQQHRSSRSTVGSESLTMSIDGSQVTCCSTNTKRTSTSSSDPSSALIIQLINLYTQNYLESLKVAKCLRMGDHHTSCANLSRKTILVSESNNQKNGLFESNCARISNVYTEGFLVCTSNNNESRVEVDYFTAGDGKIYTGWRKAPSNQLIRPSWTPNPVFTYLTTRVGYNFTCIYITHAIIANSRKLSIESKNGITKELEEGTITSLDLDSIVVSCTGTLFINIDITSSTTIHVQREENCDPHDSVRCFNGQCILDTLECNGDKDCQDGSDESSCEVVQQDQLQGQSKAITAPGLVLFFNGTQVTCCTIYILEGNYSRSNVQLVNLYTETYSESISAAGCLRNDSGDYSTCAHLSSRTALISNNNTIRAYNNNNYIQESNKFNRYFLSLCENISNVHPEGVLYCGGDNIRSSIESDYFTGLDGKIYTDKDKVPPLALLVPSWTPNANFTYFTVGVGYYFNCLMVNHTFIPRTQKLFINSTNGDSREIRQGTITTLDLDSTDITCTATLSRNNIHLTSSISISVESVQRVRCDQNYDFTCTNGQCILYSQTCDGVVDCQDSSDELNCKSRTCKSQYFKCSSGECVYKLLLCNGISGCLDGSHRGAPVYCERKPCLIGEYRCDNGQCISGSYECDGIPDCSNGSDELYCSDFVPDITCNYNHNATFQLYARNKLVCNRIDLARSSEFSSIARNTSWLFNGVIISKTGDITNSTKLISSTNNNTSWTLIFLNVTQKDEGMYTFETYNSFGKCEVHINVTVAEDASSCSSDSFQFVQLNHTFLTSTTPPSTNGKAYSALTSAQLFGVIILTSFGLLGAIIWT